MSEKLSDGTEVPDQEEGSIWSDGKSVVITPEPAIAVIEVIHDPDDPRLNPLEGAE